MKRIVLICLCVTLLIFCGCSQKSEYSDSVPCSEIIDIAEAQIPVNLGYETFDSDHVEYYFDGTELDDDRDLRYSVLSENINEFGVFHAHDTEGAKELLAITEGYIEELRQEKKAFIESYAPDEARKLEDAEVRIYGKYVAYAILSEEDREIFFDTVRAVLMQKDR